MKRALGPVDAACVVIGAIVGVGIFFQPSNLARLAGNETSALAIWVLGGVVSMLGAFSFAELGRRYARVGGQYDALRDAYGAPVAFLYVFCNLTAIQAGAVAIIGLICADNLFVALTGNTPSPAAAIAIGNALIWGLALVNVLGVRAGSSIQNLTVFAKLLVLAAVIGLALFAARSDRSPSETSGDLAAPGVLFAGLIPAMFCFGGWQQALWMGGEIKNPTRNLPRAIIGGVLIVVLVYVTVSWAYFRLLGYHGVTGASALAADAVSTVLPEAGRRVIAAAVTVSAFGVLNAQFLTGPRLTYAMARDGRFFGVFARVSPRFATPVAAIVLLGAIATTLILVAGRSGIRGIDPLTAWVVVIDGLFFALTALTLLVFHRRHIELRTSRLFLAVPIIFAALELAAIWGALTNPLDASVRNASVTGLLWIACAGICYAIFFRKRRAV